MMLKRSIPLLALAILNLAVVACACNLSALKPAFIDSATAAKELADAAEDFATDVAVQQGTVEAPQSQPALNLAYGNPCPLSRPYLQVPASTTQLRLRGGPGMGFTVLGYVVPGQCYRVIGEQSGWVQIGTSRGDGWVSRSYVDVFGVEHEAPEPTSEPPVVARYSGLSSEECAAFKIGVDGAICGMVSVPQDPQNPASGSLNLAVVVLRSRNANDAASDPLVYLAGGPGGSALSWVKDWSNSPLREMRDIIFFDQRGVGYSTPSLDCTEWESLVDGYLNGAWSLAESLEHWKAAAIACRDRLRGAGIDLSLYTSANNAADLAALQTALGIREWNLYGVSYGTRLALTAMRDHPAGIRSVILDSVYPPSVDLFEALPLNTMRAFNTLFDGCAGQAACRDAYPDLRDEFYAVVSRLDANPKTFGPLTLPWCLGDNNWSPFDNKLVLTDELFVDAIFNLLYRTSEIAKLPDLIHQAYKEDYCAVGRIVLGDAKSSLDSSEGMHYSVQCHDEYPFTRYAEVYRNASADPRLEDYFLSQAYFDICPIWGAGQAGAIENQPVVSDIPTLVLAGEYDPITPPDWGRLARETLSRSFFYEFPSVGHGVVTTSDCAQALVQAFLNAPSANPDASCISGDPPQFRTED